MDLRTSPGTRNKLSPVDKDPGGKRIEGEQHAGESVGSSGIRGSLTRAKSGKED
jgi:hypothetical protein